MEDVAILETIAWLGAILGCISAAFTIRNNMRQIRLQRDAPTEKRINSLEERIREIETWQREIGRGYTVDNNERWTDNSKRWDTFALYVKDQHALNQATIGSLLVLLDKMLKDNNDEDLKLQLSSEQAQESEGMR